MGTTWTISAAWKDRLSQAGLGSFDEVLGFDGGEMLSPHVRGWVKHLDLACGQRVYIKCDLITVSKDMLTDLCYRHKPVVSVERECRAIDILTQWPDVTVPEIIARGERRAWGLPKSGVMITLPMAGEPFADILQRGDDDEIDHAISVIAPIFRKFLDGPVRWWDMVPRHLYLIDDDKVGVLDLQRLRPLRFPGVRRIPRQMKRMRKAFLGLGTQAQLDHFLKAIE